jgi:AcrR family transcriptional regulator
LGIQERKDREKEQRRLDILNAAEKVFFSKGVRNATMDDVAEAAELSKGTLYLYYKNREELYLAITLRALDLLKARFREAAEKIGTGLQKVFAIGETFYRFSYENPDYFNALSYYEFTDVRFDGAGSMAGQCSDCGQECLDILIDSIRIGQADGSVRPDMDPVSTALILWGQTTGVIQLMALKGEHLHLIHGLDIGGLVEKSFHMVRCALEKR